jgi:hypothetical protein
MADKKDINKKKGLGSGSVLVKLYNNRRLVTKVDNMLDEGQTYEYITEFCKENGLNISKASLTNYKKKREESIQTGVPLLQLLDKRNKDNVTYISNKQVDEFKKQTKEQTPAESNEQTAVVHSFDKMGNIWSDLELLDEVIRKGYEGLKQFDVVDTPLAMKAIELRAKLTNNQLNGLSVAGLKEIRLRQHARESALMSVIMKYVPEDQHDQLFEDMDAEEEAFYDNLDLTEEERRISKAIKASGFDEM